MRITYYLEILSSWCHWAEPAWSELQAHYQQKVVFDWKIALMNPGDFPVSQNQCDWFYRRSGGTTVRSPYMLSSGWFEPQRQGHYEAPNLVAEAARDLGVTGDAVRLALTKAAVRDGRKIGDIVVAVAIAAEAGMLDAKRLRERAESTEILSRVQASTAEFNAHQISQRPAFILTDAIGDKVVLSGLVRIEPIAAAIDAMLADSVAYAAHEAHHGRPPNA